MDLKAPSSQEPGLLMLPRVPPSALSSCSALSRGSPSTPASVTVNGLPTWGTKCMRYLPPCRSRCHSESLALVGSPLQQPAHGPFLEERPWAATAGFPSLEKSQKARNFPTPHFRSAQPLTPTGSHTQESPTRLPQDRKPNEHSRVPSGSGSWGL